MERWLLLLFFLSYVALAFVLPSWRVWRQTGRNPYVLPSGDDAQGYASRGFRAVLVGLGAHALLQGVAPETTARLGPLASLDHPALHATGWALLLLALGCTVVAQWQMGHSWRIGMDQANQTALVSHGMFRISRNPVFLAMRISLLGMFLARPNAVTLTLAVAGEILMQMQVRQEEAFLRERHGAAYVQYCARTPRWL